MIFAEFFAVLCCVSSIDVVCGRGSSTSSLPLDSIKCDAKSVLTIVDLPRPLCPANGKMYQTNHFVLASLKRLLTALTDKHDVESKSALQKLVFDLLGDG